MPRKTRRVQPKRKQSRRVGGQNSFTRKPTLTPDNVVGVEVVNTSGSDWNIHVGNVQETIPNALQPGKVGSVQNALQPGNVGPEPNPEEKANGYWAYLYRMLLGDLEPVEG
jgi:hypothetical protein